MPCPVMVPDSSPAQGISFTSPATSSVLVSLQQGLIKKSTSLVTEQPRVVVTVRAVVLFPNEKYDYILSNPPY